MPSLASLTVEPATVEALDAVGRDLASAIAALSVSPETIEFMRALAETAKEVSETFDVLMKALEPLAKMRIETPTMAEMPFFVLPDDLMRPYPWKALN